MRRASKLLITMLTLTVLFAIFAISASAAGTGTSEDPYTGEITADTAWGNGTYVGPVTISGDTTITIDGTVTVVGKILIGANSNINFVGDDNTKDILVAAESLTDRMIHMNSTSSNSSVSFEDITVSGDGNATVWTIGAYYSEQNVINVNDGAIIAGDRDNGTILGDFVLNVNAGGKVTNSVGTSVGIGNGDVNVNGGTIEGATYAITFRADGADVNYYSGTVSGTDGVYTTFKNTCVPSFIVYKAWATAEDPSYDSTDWTNNKWWDVATEYIVEVSANIDATAGITISAGPTITIIGKNLGTAESPVYPTIKNMSTSSVSTAFVNISASAKLVLENITIDANGYTGDITGTPTKTTQGTRPAFVNANAHLTLNNATLKNGYTTSYGGGIGVSSSGGTIIMNEGSLITGNYCAKTGAQSGGGVNVNTGTFIMNGGTISGNYSKGMGAGINTYNGTFKMYGGTITGNISASNGGGVATNSGKTYIYGGTISNNTGTNGTAVWGNNVAAGYTEIAGVTIEGNISTNNTCGGAQNYAGTLVVHNTVVFGTNYKADGETARMNLNGGTASRSANISFVFHYNKDNASKLVNWADEVVGGDTTVGFAATAPWTKGAKGGTLTLLIVGEVNSGALNITSGANIVIKGKNGTADKLCYVGNTSNRAVSVREGGTLTVENITITAEKSTAAGTRGIVVESGATLNINGGTVITGGFGVSGAGIYNQGVVVMNGGSITGNKAKGGAGAVNNNGSAASFTMLGGSISGNTATEEGAGVYTFKGAAFVIGGDAVVSGNTTDGIESNVCIQVNEDYTSSATINADFTGSVGFHAEYNYADATLVLGTVADGAAGTVTSDEKNVTLTIAEGSATLTFTAEDITISSPNNTTVAVSSIARGAYKLPTPAAPAGYDDNDFIGYVVVSGYGTAEAKAEKILEAGTMIDSDDLANTYAVWANVNTLIGASAQISENSGIRFFTTVNDADLAAVGIKVKAGNAEGDGYYRGTLLGTSATDLTEALSKDNYKMDVKVNNTGWSNPAAYGVVVDADLSTFAVSITYGSENYYNNAVAYRGYIEITVGDTVVTLYSDFTNPGTLNDSADASYGDVHARSACAIVRNVYFSGDYPNEEELIAAIGEENYAIALKIAGYASFPA